MRNRIATATLIIALTACSNSRSGRKADASDVQANADATTALDAADGADSGDGLDGASATTAGDGADNVDGADATNGQTGTDGVESTEATDGFDATEFTDLTDASDATDSADGSTTGVDSPLVDPNCVDGQWTEQLPPANASLAAATGSYSPNKSTDFILQALSVRYPTGQWIVEGGMQSDAFGGQNCIDMFLNDKSSAGAVINQMSTIVHECGHFFDLDQGGFTNSAYMLTPSVQSTCSGASYQGTNATFARSLIKNDEYNALRPPCGGSFVPGCDSYADIYLNGDPNDSNFDSGDQGFNMLHEETTQYVNSIAVGYAFADQYQFTVSERDGILTFLWYTCRYLRMARLQYPGSYNVLTQSACWREAILRVWGRAWLFLEATKDASNLGISDDTIETLLTDELLQEIQLVREAHGC